MDFAGVGTFMSADLEMCMNPLRAAVRSIGRNLGLDIDIQRDRTKQVGAMSYGRVAPVAEYSPWLDDEQFQRVMRVIEPNTLVDQFRAFELWQLVPQVLHLPGDILEVGVWRGGTGALLCLQAPGKTVYLADTFTGVVKAGDNDAHYSGGEHSDTSAGTVRDLLAGLGVTNASLLVGIFPDDFPVLPSDYCLIHIDVDVYDSAEGIMQAVWPKLAVGGIVVFDDYGFDTTSGIARLVDTYRGDADKIVIHNLNGHGIVVKRAI